MLFIETSGNYVRAAWSWAKSRLRLASHGLATPTIQCKFWKKVCRTSVTFAGFY